MQRHAIITGTSSGIGRALAADLLGRGWRVLGVARRDCDLAAHEGYRHINLDLGDLKGLEARMEQEARPYLEGVQHLALVNNAAQLEPLRSSLHLPAEELERSLVVNVATPMWLAGWCLRLDAERTRIVNLSSGAATSAYPGWAAYCSTKAALKMAGEVLASEVAEVPELVGRDVRVLSYAPHVVRTEMQEKIRATDPAEFPRRERFIDLDREEQLVTPEASAGELARLLDEDELETLTERRYSPPA